MTLEHSAHGLWLDPTLAGQGAHALVIGISDYPYLDGSSTAGGLNKLAVSAKTAARIFDWLRHTGTVAGAPLASCRLLLAPCPDEKAEVDELTGGGYATCTFNALREATGDWGDALSASGKAAPATVAFFFFSGHGMEHLCEPSLLAMDILNPASARRGGQALAFDGLCKAVKTYGVNRALFFIDACRNAPDIAKRLHIVGQSVLEPNPEALSGPDALVWLQATRMGDFAYQLPEAEATIFGQALIEALKGLPPEHLPYDRSEMPWKLVFGKLEDHVKQRTQELIAARSVTLMQTVQSGGGPFVKDLLVAEKMPESDMAVIVGIMHFRTAFTDRAFRPREPSGPSIEQRFKAIRSRFINVDPKLLGKYRQRKGLAAPPAAGDLGDYATMHAILGSEALTNPWLKAISVVDLDDRTPAGRAIRVHAGQYQETENGRRRTVWLDIFVASGSGKALWIELDGLSFGRGFAVAVPRDARVEAPIRLEFSFSRDLGFTGFSARIGSTDNEVDRASQPGSATPSPWASLWDLQQTELLGDLGAAGLQAEQQGVLEKILSAKTESPLAAAAAASLLLRAGALAELHDWPRNLADWYPWLVDGAILWAETLRQRGATRLEALDYFLRIAERGAPLLTPVLRMALEQSAYWQKQDIIGTEMRRRLERACTALQTTADSAVSDGLFLAFVDQDIKAVRKAIAATRGTQSGVVWPEV